MSTGKKTVTGLCRWEGNRRSGVAPVMPHKLSGIQVLRPKEGRREPRLYAREGVYHPLSLPGIVIVEVANRNESLN